jgi:asparagine synthase (glutamine-hydrolysing)
MAYDILLSSRAGQRGYFSTSAVEQLLKEHNEHHADHGAHLWDLLMLEMWNRTFIDGDGLAPLHDQSADLVAQSL